MSTQLDMFEQYTDLPAENQEIIIPELRSLDGDNNSGKRKKKKSIYFKLFPAAASLSFKKLIFYLYDQESSYASCTALEGQVIIGVNDTNKTIWVISNLSYYDNEKEQNLLNSNHSLKLYTQELPSPIIQPTRNLVPFSYQSLTKEMLVNCFSIDSRLFTPAVFSGFEIKNNTPLVIEKGNYDGLIIFKIYKG